ncbi:MAG TPA: thermonuclease family protein [Candidatus Krumholzibacteria bacterium]|nr:thermonuclease family protein [Candidatus Krumholzibacteria bacterium]
MIRNMQPRAITGLLLAILLLSGCRQAGGSEDRASSYAGAATVDVAQIQFDDGDTFLYRDDAVRVLGIDTPEISEPDVGIFQDQPYGREAADSTRALITRAKRVEIAYDGRDIYDRRLAHVFVDGELLAVRLLGMGLAYENVSHFGDNGFPDLADRILQAAHEGPKPAFEPPHRWRKKHQKKPEAAKEATGARE